MDYSCGESIVEKLVNKKQKSINWAYTLCNNKHSHAAFCRQAINNIFNKTDDFGNRFFGVHGTAGGN